MGNPVVHFEVMGQDADTLQRFYRDAFGWQIESVMPTYALVHPGGEGGIDGGVGSGMEGDSGHVTFYIEVPDLDQALARIESLGGHRLQGPMNVEGDGPALATFEDPEGHLIGLIKARSMSGQ